MTRSHSRARSSDSTRNITPIRGVRTTTLPLETGSPDGEWSGSRQPLPTDSADSYVTEEVASTCRIGTGTSGSTQVLMLPSDV